MEFFHPLFLSRLEFLKAAFWALFFFWFSSTISPTLWKILFISLLMTPHSAIPSVIPQTGKQQLLRSLQIWIKSQTGTTRGTCLLIVTNLTLSLCLSERTVWKNPPSTLSTILWKKSFLSSFRVSLSATIFSGKATSPSWPPAKARRRLGIPSHAKSFLGTPELQTTNKTFILSLMEYFSPLWGGAPASHHAALEGARL